MAEMTCKCCNRPIMKGQRIASLELCMGTFEGRSIMNYVPSMIFVAHLDCWARMNLKGINIMKKAESGEI